MRRAVATFLLLLAACTSIAADARTFEGTSWRVTAINGRATPAAGDYRIEFRKGRIVGSFGCNHLGGPYRLGGRRMIVRDLVATEMACAEPAKSFERAGFRVLARPMELDWSSSRRLRLSNSAGSIHLSLKS